MAGGGLGTLGSSVESCLSRDRIFDRWWGFRGGESIEARMLMTRQQSAQYRGDRLVLNCKGKFDSKTH